MRESVGDLAQRFKVGLVVAAFDPTQQRQLKFRSQPPRSNDGVFSGTRPVRRLFASPAG